MSDVIVELTGINVLKVLGLLLANGQGQTEIRCGIVDFKDRQGLLGSTTVFFGILPTFSSLDAAKSISTANALIYPCREIPRS